MFQMRKRQRINSEVWKKKLRRYRFRKLFLLQHPGNPRKLRRASRMQMERGSTDPRRKWRRRKLGRRTR